MAKLTNTIIEGTLQVEQDTLISGDLTCMEYINTKGIRYSYEDLGSKTDNFVIDCDTASAVKFTVAGDLTIGLTTTSPESMTKEILLIITNGGAYNLTWPASVTWVKNVEPVLSTSGTDVISLILLGDSVTWLGSLNTSGSIFIDGGTWD